MTVSTRRTFLGKSAIVAAGAAATPYFPWSQSAFANLAANDRPQIGCIGVGSMGTGDARDHAHFGDIVAVCDVDQNHAEKAKNDPQIGKGKADAYGDYRKVLDRNDIDVVSIVTPDHWHVKIAIEALKAGKHVFCQKPLTLTLEENQLIRNACKKYKDKVFIVGTQQRSDKDRFLRAVNMVQKGLLGDIQKDHRRHQRRRRRRAVQEDDAAAGTGLEHVARPGAQGRLHQGALPLPVPLVVRILGRQVHRLGCTSRRYRHVGNGRKTSTAWARSKSTAPTPSIPYRLRTAIRPSTTATTRRNDFAVKCKFANGIEMTIDSRSENGILFEGTKGRIFVSRGKITGKPIEENWDKDQYTEADLQQLYKDKPFEGHKKNFYRCIREGGLPVSDVFTHVMALNTCHLAAIAARLNRTIKWDPQSERIVDDEQAAGFLRASHAKGLRFRRV